MKKVVTHNGQGNSFIRSLQTGCRAIFLTLRRSALAILNRRAEEAGGR